MHRTLSWLKKANEEASLDFKFISLWIAFNAAYADELSKEEAEHRVFHQFIIRLCELDSEHLLYGIIWDEFPSTVKALLDTPYTFQPFWDAHNGLLQGKEWKTMFAAAKKSQLCLRRTKNGGYFRSAISSFIHTKKSDYTWRFYF